MDEDNSGEIEFSEFCKVIEKHKAASAANSDEQDTIDAFVALGGNVRGRGCCAAAPLAATSSGQPCFGVLALAACPCPPHGTRQLIVCFILEVA